jgi:hypothetical protein
LHARRRRIVGRKPLTRIMLRSAARVVSRGAAVSGAKASAGTLGGVPSRAVSSLSGWRMGENGDRAAQVCPLPCMSCAECPPRPKKHVTAFPALLCSNQREGHGQKRDRVSTFLDTWTPGQCDIWTSTLRLSRCHRTVACARRPCPPPWGLFSSPPPVLVPKRLFRKLPPTLDCTRTKDVPE